MKHETLVQGTAIGSKLFWLTVLVAVVAVLIFSV